MFGFFDGQRNESLGAIVGFCNPAGSLGASETPLPQLRYDSSMFSELVMEHFRNPRNAGKLPNATAEVQATNPVCGDILELAVRVENDEIADARFLCRGCTTSIACASFLTEEMKGRTLAAARLITADAISVALGGLPPATFHGAQLAADALRMLLEKVARTNSTAF
jgi:nitrogen fixation NifU-like protein